MTTQQVLEGVRTVLREKLGVRCPIEPHTDLFTDLELDSLQQLTLVVELENHFRICFVPGTEAGISSVAGLITAVCAAAADEDGHAVV